MLLKGRILLAQKNNRDALSQLQSAVAANPDSPIAQYYLGLAHMQLGDKKHAEVAFMESAKNAGRFAMPNFALAMIQSR